MELLEYYNILMKRKWIVLGVFLIVVGVVYIKLIRTVPIYQSTVKLLLTDYANNSALSDLVYLSDSSGSSKTYGRSDPIETQIEIIKTRPMLEQTIKALDLRDKTGDPLYTGFLSNLIKVSAIRNTNIIKISYRNRNPKLASQIANTLAEVFVSNSRQMNQEETRMALRFMEEQLAKRRISLEESEQLLLQFRKSKNTVSFSKETELLVTRLSAMSAEKLSLESQLQVADAKLNDLQNRVTGRAMSPFVFQWKNEINKMNNDKDSLRANILSLEQKIWQINNELKQLPPKEIQLARLVSDSQIENEIYNKLLMRLEETKISEAAQVASVRIIEPAIPGRRPVHPDKRKTMSMALVIGLFIGYGLAFILEFFDSHIQSITEIDLLTNWKRLGLIPDFSEIKDHHCLISKMGIRSPLSESYSTLRTNLHYSKEGQPIEAILVTSSLPQEGKTTISANLAISQALAGKKVILVDADMRKAKIHKLFEIPNSVGLTSILASDVDYKKVISETETPNLFVIPRGPLPPNPLNLIESKAMVKLIKALKQDADLVIIDTPPLNLVSDALVLGHLVDGILMVVDMQNSSRASLKQSVEVLKNMAMEPLGYVINRFEKVRGKYYAYDYKYGEEA